MFGRKQNNTTIPRTPEGYDVFLYAPNGHCTPTGYKKIFWGMFSTEHCTPNGVQLIEMDVITLGDFRIQNINGNSVFTFSC